MNMLNIINTYNLKNINKNIYVINNNTIKFKIMDILININDDIYNKILNLNVLNYINITDYNKEMEIKYKNCVIYDYIIMYMKKTINSSNIINFIINCLIYYIEKYDIIKFDKFKKILKDNFEGINKSKINYIKIYFNKNIFKEINNLDINLEIIFYNINYYYKIDNIIVNDNDIIYHLEKNINNEEQLILKYNDNLNYIYNVINKDKEICKTLNLYDFITNTIKINCMNKRKINKILNNIEKIEKIEKKYDLTTKFNNDCLNFNLMKSPPVLTYLLHYLNIFMNKYKIDIDNDKIAFSTSAGYGIIMRDKNNYQIKNCFNYSSIGRRNVLYTILKQDFPDFNLKKNDFIGLISNKINLNRCIKTSIIFIVKLDCNYKNKFNIIGGFYPEKNDILMISFDDIIPIYYHLLDEFCDKKIQKKINKFSN